MTGQLRRSAKSKIEVSSCGCPAEIVSMRFHTTRFDGLDESETCFPLVSRLYKGAFIAQPPDPRMPDGADAPVSTDVTNPPNDDGLFVDRPEVLNMQLQKVNNAEMHEIAGVQTQQFELAQAELASKTDECAATTQALTLSRQSLAQANEILVEKETELR